MTYMNQIHIPLWEDAILESDGAGGFIQKVPTSVRSLTLSAEDVVGIIGLNSLKGYAHNNPDKVKEVPVTYSGEAE